MDEEQYAALLSKIAELEARLEAQSHHGMDHGAGDALDNGILLREIKITPPSRPEAATLYLQDNGATNKLMLQHPTGAAVNITGGVVTNGDSHDHNGGDGAQIDHGGLAGLGDDDHTQYIKHSLATALSDFLVASGAGAFVKKTLAEVKTILGLGSAAYTASTDYEPAIANGTANYLRGMNAAANAKEWKSLVGTSNRVTVTHGANLITLSGPQDLHTAAVPTFAGVIGAYLKPAADSTTALQLQQSGGTAVLTVDTTNSRLGLGVTPASKLHIAVTAPDYYRISSSTADEIGYTMHWSGGGAGEVARLTAHLNTGEVRVGGTAAAYFVTLYAGGSERVRILTGGNVGIGCSPSYLLHVNTDSAGKPGVGGLWTVVSDARIKKDIVMADLDRCYEIVKTVPLKRFAWADGVYAPDQVNDQQVLGWIAQDVQPVFPKATGVVKFTKNAKLPDGEDDVITDCLDLNGGQMLMAMYGAVQKLISDVEKLQQVKVDKPK